MNAKSDTGASNVTLLKTKEDVSPSRPDWLKPLIPAGTYTVAFDYHETTRHFGNVPKMGLYFHVSEFGKYFQTPLIRWYTVDRIIGKARKNGYYRSKGQTCILMIEYVRCFSNYPLPRRLDRIPMSPWKKHEFLVKVRNVRRNSRQKAIPAQSQYSVIDSILGIAE